MSELITDDVVEAVVQSWVSQAAAVRPDLPIEAMAAAGGENIALTVRLVLEAAAPLIAGRALREAANDWQTGEWANVPRHADRVADRLGAAQHVSDWLRAEAGRVERSGT